MDILDKTSDAVHVKQFSARKAMSSVVNSWSESVQHTGWPVEYCTNVERWGVSSLEQMMVGAT